MATAIALNMTATGAQPTTPAALRATLIALAQALDPTLTTDLPGSLIEDIASTDVGALTVIDSAVVDFINSLDPRTANQFLLVQLAAIYGVPPGSDTNTSVFVVFSGAGAVGFTVPRGFTVSDGTHQYVVQEGGIVETGGATAPLYALATTTGAWAVPANTVNQLVTSLPGGIVLTVSNPTAGVPQEADQTPEDFRAQVLQAGLAEAQGVAAFMRTQLENIPGVQARLISTRLISNLWEVIVGGGDPYAIAQGIYEGIGAGIGSMIGSTLHVTGITNANPGVVTTDLNHGYTTGQVIGITGVVGMSGINGVPITVTVIGEKTFSIGINTTGSGAWTSGGVVTPNLRNISVSINDYPDSFTIPYVNPPQQTVTVALTWNTTSPNFVSPAAVSQAAVPAIIAYINSIYVGQPINVFELDSVFQTAVAAIIGTPLISRIVWAISINGVPTDPGMGTGLISGDPESYFYCDQSTVTVSQG